MKEIRFPSTLSMDYPPSASSPASRKARSGQAHVKPIYGGKP